MGVMGNASSLQSYPIFTLFQLASIGPFSRLDMFHTAFWVFALFLKCSVLVYSSSVAIKKYNHSTKCIVNSVIVCVATIFINEVIGTKIVDLAKIIAIATFVVFCVAIPALYLFIGKRKDNDLIEKI
jgi:hypothetical membrane protein